MQALNDYIKNFKCDWEENMDASDRSLSVMDEYTPEIIPYLVVNESINFDTHVWGDIYRNGFLLDVNNPPEQLTPNDDEESK